MLRTTLLLIWMLLWCENVWCSTITNRKNERNQKSLQPLEDTTDVVSVIKGVIEAEEGAMAQYNKIIKICDGVDYVSQDMAITLLSGEEDHRREFLGFLTEYEKGRPA